VNTDCRRWTISVFWYVIHVYGKHSLKWKFTIKNSCMRVKTFYFQTTPEASGCAFVTSDIKLNYSVGHSVQRKPPPRHIQIGTVSLPASRRHIGLDFPALPLRLNCSPTSFSLFTVTDYRTVHNLNPNPIFQI